MWYRLECTKLHTIMKYYNSIDILYFITYYYYIIVVRDNTILSLRLLKGNHLDSLVVKCK